MDVEKERLSGNFLMPNWVSTEHHSRFKFTANYTIDKIVVDCACGNGEGTNIFSEGTKATYGFDVSEEALVEARQKCTNPHAIFQKASGTKLPLGNNFADVYVSLETIEHIDEDEDFLQEVSRVLKNGGIFICSTPNRMVTNPGKTLKDKPANVFHIREYSVEEFTALLSKYFSKVEMHGQNKSAFLKTSLLGFIGKFLPLHLAVRMHQANKLAMHIFRSKSYYELEPCREDVIYEYVTAVCTK